MKQVAIFGVSGCGRGVMPLAREQWAASGEPHQLVFVDDNPPASEVNGHPVLTYYEWVALPASSRHINIAIANGAVREQLVERCASAGVQFFEVRAASVVQLDAVQLGEGAILALRHTHKQHRIGSTSTPTSTATSSTIAGSATS